MTDRLVIIGGVAAGMSAAARARRVNPDMEIVVYERGGYVSFGACGFPFFLKGEIRHIHDLLARTPEDFTRQGIEVHTCHEVTTLDPACRTLSGVDLQTGLPFTDHWDKLILAMGVSVTPPPLPGSRLPGIFSLRTVEDVLAIKSWLASVQPRSAVIIGGSYMGLEIAEALLANGVAVSLIEKQPQVLGNLDDDISAQVLATVRGAGIDVYLESTAESFIGEKLVGDLTARVTHALERANGNGLSTAGLLPQLRVREVILAGKSLPADLVILGTGGKPNVGLAVQAGVALGPTGAIAVDAQQHTSVENIWAAGGVAEVHHRLTSCPVYMPTALNANKQGRVAGTNAAGGQENFSGTYGAGVVQIFGVTIAHTGLTEKQARQSGFDAQSNTITGWSQAAYMPGAAPLHIKLVYERGTQRVLGAQMLGREGVGKRIDVVTAALQAGWTLGDLADLDTAYTPPVASVWEPLVIAAHVAGRKG